MTSEQLAKAVEQAIKNTRGRILGVGREQYELADGRQGFEDMSIRELLDWASEEAEDIIVYGVMLQIRIQRVKRAIKNGFDV
ncbi:hypothetical protein [Microtetraspora malaysiensis]|uniref:hypothetical protein n=1 Tax=Microtetraspora malaysiensis TaxID=161358 RepID=UPI003D8A562E